MDGAPNAVPAEIANHRETAAAHFALDHAADLLVVDAVDDRRHGHDLDAGVVQVLDRAQLHVEQVADRAMRVGRVADAIELQVRITHSCFGGLLRKSLEERGLKSEPVGIDMSDMVTLEALHRAGYDHECGPLNANQSVAAVLRVQPPYASLISPQRTHRLARALRCFGERRQNHIAASEQ